MSNLKSVFIVICKNGRGGESVDSVYSSEGDARARKNKIRAYRVEKHKINERTRWTKEDERSWANEELKILNEQERHNFGDN